MVNYAGHVMPLFEGSQLTLTTSLDDGLETFGGFGAVDLGMLAPNYGTLVHTGSSPLLSRNFAAHQMPSWADSLFNHIFVLPAELELGNFFEGLTRTVEVANLWLVPRSWQSIESTAGEGIALEDIPAFPDSIRGLGSRIFTVSIGTDGPTTIDGDLILGFDTETISVPITGQRIVIFQFQPLTDLVEIVEWSTDIIESYDGSEQRVKIRIAPRQRISYKVGTESADGSKLRATLFDWLARVFGLPIWFEKRNLTAPALAGALELALDTRYADFRAGGLLLIYSSNSVFEALEIDTFDDTSIQLVTPVSRNYPAGTFVMPIRTAYAVTMTSTERRHDGYEQTDVEFITLDNEDLSDSTESITYDGRIVIADANIVADAIPESFDRSVIIIDNSSGRLYQVSRTDASRLKSLMTWDLPSPAELWRVRQLLHAFGGSQKAFWFVSCRPDFELAEPISSSADTIRIVNVGYSTFIRARRPLSDIRIVLNDGTIVHRRIIDAESDGEEEILTLNASLGLGAEVTNDDISRIELLTLMRIADDRAEIQHRNINSATASVSLISVKD